MNLREAVRIALRGLRANRLRSALTMIGVIIGVAAVILLVAIGNGVQTSVNNRVGKLANLITVVPTTGNAPGSAPKNLIDADADALRNSDQAPDVASVTPAVIGQAVVSTRTVQSRTSITGSTDQWLEVNNRKLQAGSFFDADQVSAAAKVVVLGPTAVGTLFPDDPAAALGQTVRINRQNFRVIGVLESVGEPADNTAVMPLNAARRDVFGGGDLLNEIIVQATRVATVPAAMNQVINILSDRHRIKNFADRDFQVQSLGSQLKAFSQILDILTLFTVSIAAISLFVGGIGVLNIMLVSVTERTREIGIRKAIGATRGAILEQFLIESVVLAGLGGAVGVLLGIGLSVLGAIIAPALGPAFTAFAPVVTVPSIVISFAISLAIGLIAGGYPANRAARLRPIEALRYE
ncbi:MAG: ABC transporter permease [Pseudonocardiaceae bacterium]